MLISSFPDPSDTIMDLQDFVLVFTEIIQGPKTAVCTNLTSLDTT